MCAQTAGTHARSMAAKMAGQECRVKRMFSSPICAHSVGTAPNKKAHLPAKMHWRWAI